MYTVFTFATLPRTTRGNAIVLGSDPKGVNFLYTNGNSVIIRNIEVSTLTFHSPPPLSIISSMIFK